MVADEAFRKSIVEGLVNGTLGQTAPTKSVENFVESKSQGVEEDGTGELGGIVEDIIKNRLIQDTQVVEGLEEARKEAVSVIDWGIADALFGK